MNRRGFVRLFGLIGGGGVFASQAARPASVQEKGIVLYCDLAVDPSKEREMLNNFHQYFKPAAMKFDGYIDVKVVKLRRVVQGGPPLASDINYRFQLTYESEEKRQHWINSRTHKKVWPLIENTVTNKDYLVLLTDVR
jgi:hypothetical protein